MHRILESCPSCGGELEIRELVCRECGTEIRGHYTPCPFCRLTPEQSRFLELFVQARGNMRVLEQKLSVSYPTVRNRIEAIGEILSGGRGTPESATADSGQESTPNGATAEPARRRGGRPRRRPEGE